MRRGRYRLLFAALIGVVFCAGAAFGGDTNWIAAAGDWSDANNWTAGEPNANTGARIANGGTVTISSLGEGCSTLFAGYAAGQSGAVNLVSGSLTTGRPSSAGNLYVGYIGPGSFVHSDGNNDVFGALYVGYWGGGSGSYQLSGAGRLSARSEVIGNLESASGTGGVPGLFTQTGGENLVWDLQWGTNYGGLSIGGDASSAGKYRLSGEGRLTAYAELVGCGVGEFVQTDGNNTASDSLCIGWRAGSSGIYRLSGNGRLVVGWEIVGFSGGIGQFYQSGGNHTVGSLYLSAGTLYEMTGGSLQVDGNLENGGNINAGNGTGAISVAGRLLISGGIMTIGGSLDVNQLTVGASSASGSLSITSASARVDISGLLSIEPKGSLSGVPACTIHMTGSEFRNASTDANALAGLANLRMIFEGGDANEDPFEVGGRDLGADANGFVGNFGLGTLELGGQGGAGRVVLVDLFDNQPASSGTEALYVQDLIVNTGSELWLNGIHLYVNGVLVNPGEGGLYGGGVISAGVPEPGAMCLLLAGSLALLRRRGRR